MYRIRIGCLSLLVLFTAANLLYSAWSAFLSGKFKLLDYGVYTNMIWNCGHGEPFKVLVDKSYLYTHLSFSLALLGPLFRLWDSPALLLVVQWAAVCLGAVLIFRSARRRRIPTEMSLALVFFFLGYRLTQSALMAEFHGVTLYLLLIPWLYYACAFSKRMAWLPLLLLLGIREDAFLAALPLLFYFAVKDRWRGGYVLAGAALVYGIAAVFWLYPFLNGITVLDRRGKFLSDVGIMDMTPRDIRARVFGAAMLLLPLAVSTGRNMLPLFLIPSTAYLVAFLSPVSTQQSLGSHYSPPVMACLAVALLETTALRVSRQAPHPRRTPIRAWLLTGITLAVHLHSGFLYLGAKNYPIFRRPTFTGHLALRAARQLPRSGVLLTERDLAAVCANRSDLVCWNKGYDPALHDYNLVFAKLVSLPDILEGDVLRALRAGRFGVVYIDNLHVILEAGARTELNTDVLSLAEHPPLAIALTPKHGGHDVILRDGRLTRYWGGKGHKTPITLSYGGHRTLEPGRYACTLRYRAAYPEAIRKGTWGSFSVHRLNDQGPPLARTELETVARPPGDETVQALPFAVGESGDIEVRVTGGDARLWLHEACFRKLLPDDGGLNAHAPRKRDGMVEQTKRQLKKEP